MPLYPIKGTITSTITSTYDKANVEWKIPRFFSLEENAVGILESPSFLFLNAEWCLRILLHEEDEWLNSWRDLYLIVRNPSSCYSVTFTIGIKSLKNSVKFGPVTRNFDRKTTAQGSSNLFLKGSLNPPLTGNFLRVYCEAADLLFKGYQKIFLNGFSTLCRNFQELLLTGRNSDLTIAVCGQEFKAHKLVLETRSPVFAAMFENDMTEKKESVIKVEDCDPDTFQNFLQYIYAGRVEDLSVHKAMQLYMVSHKYTVTDIMDECVQLMKLEISEDNACDILTLANRYNETGLKDSAEKFMSENMSKIFSTNNWSIMMAENSLLQKYS